MIGWILLAILALVVLLACTLRVGVLACWRQDGPWVKIRVGPKLVQVYPARHDPDRAAQKERKRAAKAAKKTKKAEKTARKKPPKEPVKRDPGGLLALLWDLLPVVGETAGRFRQKLRIDDLTIDLTWAEEDPADTGIHYGQGWAVLETLLAFLEAHFTIKNREVALYADFLAEEPRIYIRAGLSLTPAQLLGIALTGAVGAGKVLWNHRNTIKPARSKAQEKKGVDDNGNQSSCQ